MSEGKTTRRYAAATVILGLDWRQAELSGLRDGWG